MNFLCQLSNTLINCCSQLSVAAQMSFSTNGPAGPISTPNPPTRKHGLTHIHHHPPHPPPPFPPPSLSTFPAALLPLKRKHVQTEGQHFYEAAETFYSEVKHLTDVCRELEIAVKGSKLGVRNGVILIFFFY